MQLFHSIIDLFIFVWNQKLILYRKFVLCEILVHYFKKKKKYLFPWTNIWFVQQFVWITFMNLFF